MTLTKRDLVMRIGEETGLNQAQVFEVVQKTLNYITEALAKGGKVELRNFGVFDVKIRKARVGRNPKKPGTDVPIPARAMVKFKAGKEMAAEVLKLTPKPTKKAPLNNQSAFAGFLNLFLHAENRVLGRLGDAELHDFLGLDLDCLASRRITSDARLAIDQDELAEAGDGERVLGVLVGEAGELFKDFDGLLFGEAVLFRDCSGDL